MSVTSQVNLPTSPPECLPCAAAADVGFLGRRVAELGYDLKVAPRVYVRAGGLSVNEEM